MSEQKTGDVSYISELAGLAAADVEVLRQKEATYGGSWKRRGGVGAFMMLARKWDRLENMAEYNAWDIFKALDNGDMLFGPGADGTPLAEIRDLRRYLLLVEAWHEWVSKKNRTGKETGDPLFAHPTEFNNLGDDSQDEAEATYYWRGRAYRSKKEAEADDNPPPAAAETDVQRFARSLNFRLNEAERSPMARHALDLLPMAKSEIDRLMASGREQAWSPEKSKRLELLRLLVTSIELAFVPPSAWGR